MRALFPSTYRRLLPSVTRIRSQRLELLQLRACTYVPPTTIPNEGAERVSQPGMLRKGEIAQTVAIPKEIAQALILHRARRAAWIEKRSSTRIDVLRGDGDDWDVRVRGTDQENVEKVLRYLSAPTRKILVNENVRLWLIRYLQRFDVQHNVLLRIADHKKSSGYEVTLKGSEKALNDAVDALSSLTTTLTTMPHAAVLSVIGHKGKRISEMEKNTGTVIVADFSDQHKCVVSITGSPEAVYKVVESLDQPIRMIPVSPAVAKWLVARNSKGLHEIETESGASVAISKPKDVDEYTAVVSGARERVERAIEMMHIPMKTFALSPECFAWLVGDQGQRIERIKGPTGALLHEDRSRQSEFRGTFVAKSQKKLDVAWILLDLATITQVCFEIQASYWQAFKDCSFVIGHATDTLLRGSVVPAEGYHYVVIAGRQKSVKTAADELITNLVAYAKSYFPTDRPRDVIRLCGMKDAPFPFEVGARLADGPKIGNVVREIYALTGMSLDDLTTFSGDALRELRDLTGAWLVREDKITTPAGEQIFYLMGEEAGVARARDRIVAAAQAVHDVMKSKAYDKAGAPQFRGISKMTPEELLELEDPLGMQKGSHDVRGAYAPIWTRITTERFMPKHPLIV